MDLRRRFTEPVIEWLLKISGSISIVVILLITLFLFKEGSGLFRSPAIESGYELCLSRSNPVERINPRFIKEIYDGEITNWKAIGGDDLEIVPFRFEEVFNRYSDEELGENYELLPEKLGEIIAGEPGIIAFIPQKFSPPADEVKVLPVEKITIADFFGGREWLPTATPAPQFGTLPLVMGTLWVSLFAILIALPLGLGVAVYMSEMAGEGVRKTLKPAIELLAGIPSVVYGFFGLVVVVPMLQRTFNLPVGETALAGSIILAIMALPTIITISEDALRNTPRILREASLALGATRWQTIYRVVVPYATSGISTAVVLGIGRAIGETMAVLMVTGNAAVIPHSLLQPVRTIPATIAAELGEAPMGGAHYQSLFLLGCMLFVITLVISISAEMISKRKHKASV